MTTITLARPVALDRGDVLRIRGGAGLTLRPERGVLWVTEEKLGDDRVIAPGDICRLEGMGLALVYAHRASRIVIEAPEALERVPDVRLAVHGGDTSKPVRLAGQARPLPARLRTAWRWARRELARVLRAGVPADGHREHDLYYSSRRKRGLALRFEVDPREALYRANLPYY